MLTALGGAVAGVGFDRQVVFLQWSGALVLAVAAVFVFLEVDAHADRDGELSRQLQALARHVDKIESCLESRPSEDDSAEIVDHSSAVKVLQAISVLAANLAAAVLGASLSLRLQEQATHDQSNSILRLGGWLLLAGVSLYLAARLLTSRTDKQTPLHSSPTELEKRLSVLSKRIERHVSDGDAARGLLLARRRGKLSRALSRWLG